MIHSSVPIEPEGIRAPKACVPCAHAKVKCETEAGETTCKRCQRLKKICRAQPPGAHKRKVGKRSDVSRLEEKLDGVAAILAASNKTGASNVAASQGLSRDVCLSSASEIERFVKNDQEAESFLNAFRDKMAPYFPFVVVPESTSLEDLKERKPFLLLVLVTLGCRHDVPRQTTMAKRIRELLSERILLKGEQNIDLLQGLLVYLAWYHIHLHLGSQITNLVHLVLAMMIDLHLNKYNTPRIVATPQREYFQPDRQANSGAPRTLEERRTFLGCFYITSIISMCAKDIEPVKFTRYADECCQLISEASEYPSDNHVVQLTRLHQLEDTINRTLNYEEWDQSWGITAPIGACMKSLEAELHKLKSVILSDLPETGGILMHYYTIETFLCEIALDNRIDASRYGTYPVARLSMLFSCLNSAKTFFEEFHSLPVSVYFDLPYTIWSLVGHMNVVLSKLAVSDCEGWDQSYVPSILNFFTVLDTLATKVKAAMEVAEPSSQHTGTTSFNLESYTVPPIFTTLTSRIQEVKAVHEAKRAAQFDRDQLGPHSSDNGVTLPGLAEEFTISSTSTNFFDFLNDDFWQHFA